jgi:two-component system aerobic respiration control sensor histidine kinase ArcB
VTQKQIKVLLIEDMQLAQKAAANVFTKLNCYFQIVPIAVQGLEEILKEDFDIIFVDLQLPDMNGFALAKVIRQLETGKRTPLIVLTSHNLTDGVTEEARTAGFDDCLQKPLTVVMAQEMLLKHLGIEISPL